MHEYTANVGIRKQQGRGITLIAYWKGAGSPKPNYLPAFFESVARQADHVELLWVNFYKGTGPPACLDLEAVGVKAKNIQALCKPEDELYNRFAGVLCDELGGWDCTESECQQTLNLSRRLGEGSANVNYKVRMPEPW